MTIILSLQAEHGWAEKEVRSKYINAELQNKTFQSCKSEKEETKINVEEKVSWVPCHSNSADSHVKSIKSSTCTNNEACSTSCLNTYWRALD